MAQFLATTSLRCSFSTLTKLVIIRHGQSIWNKHRKWAGWQDIRLSTSGKKQSKQCGVTLKTMGYQFDEAYCSVLTRSIQTLNCILDETELHHIPVHKQWRLNEKFYGSLTGQSKVQITEKYGQQMVGLWRRSFDVRPPSVDKKDDRHPSHHKRYSHLDKELLPSAEHQQDVINRVKPLWDDQIRHKIIEGKKLIISAHGSSVRALVKIISDLPEQDIKEFNVPHSVPLVYTLNITDDKKLRPMKLEYLGDEEDISLKMFRIKNQNKKTQI